MTEKDIIAIIEKDPWMMGILRVVKKLNLPDWWIGAGFVRSKVWDTLHRYTRRTPIPDIDVIYMDKSQTENKSIKSEKHYEKELKKLMPNINWSIRNQARMHLFHKDKPYKSSEEALAQWVETATCVGIRLNRKDKLVLAAPRGIDDLVNLILRPTFLSKTNLQNFKQRIKRKKWLLKWPKLRKHLTIA